MLDQALTLLLRRLHVIENCSRKRFNEVSRAA
jgi:hypothetical protein